MQAIDTVLFDFGGTLDSDGAPWKERFHALYRADGLAMPLEAFAPAFHAADDALIGALPSSSGLEETVIRLAANLETEFERRGADKSAARGRRIASRFLSDASAAFAHNRPVLEALAGRCRLGIVSNFYGNLEGVCESVGLASLFGVMADSERVGAGKPEPAIFRAALDALGASPETAVMVGDSLRRDHEGARRMAMRFIWIAPADVQAAERPAPPPLATLTRLSDLIGALA